MNDAKKIIRQDRAALERELTAAGATIRGSAVTCPFHNDSNPSGSIKNYDDGVWRFKCFVCDFKAMDVFDVKARAENLRVNEVLNEMTGPRIVNTKTKKAPRVYTTRSALEAATCWNGDGPAMTIESTFKYTNPDTDEIELEVFRLLKSDGGKSFKQASPVDGGWALTAPPKPWPLYNRTRLRGAHTVIAVEGEKAVHELTRILPPGFAATTSPGGAGKANHADWRPVSGKRIYLAGF